MLHLSCSIYIYISPTLQLCANVLFKRRYFESSLFSICLILLHNLLASSPQAELIDPALKGTVNVLNSCAKFQTVKRVVLTSSVAAVAFNGRPRTPDVVVDETWFSDPDVCKELKVCILKTPIYDFYLKLKAMLTNCFNLARSVVVCTF